MPEALIIDRVEVWSCSLSLDQPIDFGEFVIDKRHHCLVRLYTRDGLIADIIGQSRAAPVDVAVADILAPLLIGRSAADLSLCKRAASAALTALDQDGTLSRAWSLLEIGLHDLRAQSAGIPLWRMLGGDPAPVAVQIVEGYALVGESDPSFAERLAERAAEGYRLIKIEAAHYGDARKLLSRLEHFRVLAGEQPQLVLDFAWSWKNVKENRYLLDGLLAHNIAWIEDCFPRNNITSYQNLRGSTPIPVGCGDEATRLTDLLELMRSNAIDVVRADATTLGGIEAIQELTFAAKRAGIRLSFHEHPETHEHLVFGLDCADHVEVFTADRPFDCVHKLLQAPTELRISRGMLSPPDKPGTGIKFRDEIVSRHASRHHVIVNGL